MNIYKPLLILILSVIVISCGRNKLKINISDVEEEVSFVRYEQEFFSLGSGVDSARLAELHRKYPAFTDLFTYQIIRVGSPADSTGRGLIRDFLTDTVIQQSKKKVDDLFPGDPEFRKSIVRAFRYYRHYFPENPLPTIYTCISGFNESVFTAQGIIGISLDKYLGSGYRYYPLLDIPRYRQRKMIPAMIPSDVMYTWGMTEFPISPEATSLVDHMVHEGKLLYFCEAMMPELADTLLTGYTASQLKWCERNEPQMWNYLIEHKLLFSTRQMDIVRYINDGPTTNGFPPESPARTGAWLGWRIVKAYMEQHPDTTLKQLMANTRYLEILNTSAYAPQ